MIKNMKQRLDALQTDLYYLADRCVSIARELGRTDLNHALLNAELSCNLAARAIECFRNNAGRAFRVIGVETFRNGDVYVKVHIGGEFASFWVCHPDDTFEAGQYVIVGRDGRATFAAAGDPLLVEFDGHADIVIADGAGGFSMAPGNGPEVQL